MESTVFVLNGPNLNLLGTREPEIYGAETLAEVEAECRQLADSLGLELRFHQSNAEHQLIDWIHEARTNCAGIVINAAALTHTSIAIHDALRACDCPIVEVHISNVHAREGFRRRSYVSGLATAVILGCGIQGYRFALERLALLIDTGKA